MHHSLERRNARLAGQALLTGLLFDSRGHPMSPSHANKQGVRYRYYVSQALIQGRKQEAGAVARVSAPDLEERILAELKTLDRDKGTSGRELVSRLVERITLREDRIEIRLQQAAAGADLGMTAPRGWPADVDPMGPATGRGPAGHEPAKPASDLGPHARGSASGDRTSPALRRGAVARRRG